MVDWSQVPLWALDIYVTVHTAVAVFGITILIGLCVWPWLVKR